MNDSIFFFFYNLAHHAPFLDTVIVFFAVYFPYIVVMLAILFLLFHHDIFVSQNPFREFLKKWKEITFVFFSGIFAWVVAMLLKILIHTDRPFLALSDVHALITETGYSFPSQHAVFFSAIAFSIFFQHKKAGFFFIFFAILIGLARIISGVHFPADILGGFGIGFLISYIVSFRHNIFQERGEKRDDNNN